MGWKHRHWYSPDDPKCFYDGFAEGAREARRVGREPGGEHFDEGPVETGCDRSHECGLSRAGGSEEDDGAGRDDSGRCCEVGSGEGEDEPALE